MDLARRVHCVVMSNERVTFSMRRVNVIHLVREGRDPQ